MERLGLTDEGAAVLTRWLQTNPTPAEESAVRQLLKRIAHGNHPLNEYRHHPADVSGNSPVWVTDDLCVVVQMWPPEDDPQVFGLVAIWPDTPYAPFTEPEPDQRG